VADQYTELAIYHKLDIGMPWQLSGGGPSLHCDPEDEKFCLHLVVAFGLRRFSSSDRLHIPAPSDIAA